MQRTLTSSRNLDGIITAATATRSLGAFLEELHRLDAAGCLASASWQLVGVAVLTCASWATQDQVEHFLDAASALDPRHVAPLRDRLLAAWSFEATDADVLRQDLALY